MPTSDPVAPPGPSHKPLFTAELTLPENKRKPALFFLDSGASCLFINRLLLQALGLGMIALVHPLTFVNFYQLATSMGTVKSYVCMDLEFKDFVTSTVLFVVDFDPDIPICLGLNWLRTNNPTIDWATEAMWQPSWDPDEEGTLDSYEGQPDDGGVYPLRKMVKTPATDGPVFRPYAFPTANVNLPKGKLQEWEVIDFDNEDTTDSTKVVPAKYHDLIDVFSKARAKKLPPDRPYNIRINTPDDAPLPFGLVHPLSGPDQDYLKDLLDEMMKKDFIRPSPLLAGAPVMFALKKTRERRLCCDYRKLNEMTKKNRYPIPPLDGLLSSLGSGKVFTKIDLRWAYHLLQVHDGHKYKKAFRTRYGLFEWLVMPFGLTNAPSAFQHFINNVLSDFVDQFCVIYLNNILIYSPDQQAHDGHVRRVLKRLQEYNLFAKASKCKFDQSEVEFLGFRVSTEGIKPNPGKVQTIHDWPAPKTVKQVQLFLGFANFYQRFVPRYPKNSAPIDPVDEEGRAVGVDGRVRRWLHHVEDRLHKR